MFTRMLRDMFFTGDGYRESPAFRQLIEVGDDHQEMRPALFRRYHLSDEEIAIALLEDVDAATALLRRNVAEAHAAVGVDDLLAAVDGDEGPTNAIHSLLGPFEARLADVADDLARPKWPGPRICAEEVVPAVVAGDRPVELEVHGWLFDDRDLAGRPYLVVHLLRGDEAPLRAEVLEVSQGEHGRSCARVRVHAPPGVYDVEVSHEAILLDDDDPAELLPRSMGASRLAGALLIAPPQAPRSVPRARAG
ncbi:MAG: hypothetical protein R3B09_14640 [Nannocystaceae bacterium]